MIVRLTLVIDGEFNASRSWPHIPRVGDFIENELRGTEIKRVVVKEVIWKYPTNSDDCRVDLVCERETKNDKPNTPVEKARKIQSR